MKIKDFSKKVSAYNETIELVAKQIATQAPLLETAGMKQNLLALQQEKQRNDLGLIRVLFLGASSTGKSTMINTLAGKIVVPEVSHTSTMIPTWIGQTEDFAKEGVEVNYFDYDDDNHKMGDVIKHKPESIDDFRCFYCFRAEDAADPERHNKPERFKNMELNEAYMRIPEKSGLMSDYSLVLVDTLGNNATIVDDQKAQYNMRNVDFAFVLLGYDGTIDEASRNFFAGTLFNKNVSRIKPEHVVFVINKIDRAAAPAGSKKNCRQSIMSILKIAYGENIPEGLYDKLCSQIVLFSALNNRIVKAGLYPFKNDAQRIYEISDLEFDNPSSVNEETITIVHENERYEKKQRRADDEELLEEGYYADFERVVDGVVNDLFADGTIMDNHLATTEMIASSFIQNIGERLSAFAAEQKELTDKISEFNVVLSKIDKLTDEFIKDTDTIISHFPDQINSYLQTGTTQIISTFTAKSEPVFNSMDISQKTRARFNTPSLLRDMTRTQMKNLMIPEYNPYKEKLVQMLCDIISQHIFKPSPVALKLSTPFSAFQEQIMQSINNYVTRVIDSVSSINREGKIKVSVPEKTTFEHFIEEKMHHLTIQLITDVKASVDKQIDEKMADNLVNSIHKFGDGFRSFFKGVDYFYSKLNKAASESFRQAITVHIYNMMSSQQFISNSMDREICTNLRTITPFVNKLLYNYLNDVQVELKMLKEKLKEFSAREAFYREFAENSVVYPLNNVIEDIQKDRAIMQEEGMQR